MFVTRGLPVPAMLDFSSFTSSPYLWEVMGSTRAERSHRCNQIQSFRCHPVPSGDQAFDVMFSRPAGIIPSSLQNSSGSINLPEANQSMYALHCILKEIGLEDEQSFKTGGKSINNYTMLMTLLNSCKCKWAANSTNKIQEAQKKQKIKYKENQN